MGSTPILCMIKLPLLQLFLSKHKTCCACGPAAFAASSLATYLFQKAPECLMAGFCQGTCGGQDCFKQLLATACHWSETARSSWTAKKEGNMVLRAFRRKSVSACASHTALSSSVGASFASVLVMPPHHATNCTAIFRSSRACIGDLRDRRHRADLASQPVVTNPSLIRASI